MKKLTIAEASAEIGISKEAIHNRIRRGSLNCVIEDGIKYVLYDKNTKQTPRKIATKKQAINNDDKYYQLLELQNKQLENKLEKLESEIKLLREQKEQMLIAEKEKIEDIYIKKDEQLKSILTTINSTTMLTTPQKEVHDIEILEVKDKAPIKLKKQLKPKKKKMKKKLKKIKN